MAGYHPKKRLGQHFLIDQSVLDRTASLVLNSNPTQIVEIGPGQGALTERLLASDAEITAVEFDRDMIARLKNKFASAGSLNLVQSDFLRFDPADHQLERFTLAGNIPYNITSPVIDWCVTFHDRIELAVLMIQKELAQRVASGPGSKDWSPLALFTQLHYNIRLEFSIPPEAFEPPPKVWSAVITLTPKEPVPIPNHSAFERIVRGAFTQRRKTLANNLIQTLALDAQQLGTTLAKVGIEPKARAEQVTTEQFLNLTEQLRLDKLL